MTVPQQQFFDDHYAFLYSWTHRPDRLAAEADFIERRLGVRPGARLLDVCCGDGRHVVALRGRGYRVVGLDISMDLLRRCRRALGEALAGAPGSGALVRADARAAPLKPAFDGVTLLFNSIGLGTDDDTVAMLRSARAALAPGARFLLEAVNRDHFVRRDDPGMSDEDVELAGTPVTLQSEFDPLTGIQRVRFTWRSASGELLRRELAYRCYNPTELLRLLREAGFRELDVTGGYEDRPVDADCPMAVVVAR